MGLFSCNKTWIEDRKMNVIDRHANGKPGVNEGQEKREIMKGRVCTGARVRCARVCRIDCGLSRMAMPI